MVRTRNDTSMVVFVPQLAVNLLVMGRRTTSLVPENCQLPEFPEATLPL